MIFHENENENENEPQAIWIYKQALLLAGGGVWGEK